MSVSTDANRKKLYVIFKILVLLFITTINFCRGKVHNISADAAQEFCIDEETTAQPYSPPSRVEAFELFKKGRGKEINKIFLQNKGKRKQSFDPSSNAHHCMQTCYKEKEKQPTM